jgi:predicted nucleic acid-binding protein
VLLDTTFLIDLMRGDEGAVERARELEADLVQQRLAATTLFELYYGVARSDQPTAEREQVEEILSTKPVRPSDPAVMRKAGRLAGELTSDGQQVGDGDAIIAATAMIVQEPVLTRNVADFERLGVEVETY